MQVPLFVVNANWPRSWLLSNSCRHMPDICLMEGWVGPRVSFNIVDDRKIYSSCRKLH